MAAMSERCLDLDRNSARDISPSSKWNRATEVGAPVNSVCQLPRKTLDSPSSHFGRSLLSGVASARPPGYLRHRISTGPAGGKISMDLASP